MLYTYYSYAFSPFFCNNALLALLNVHSMTLLVETSESYVKYELKLYVRVII